MSEKKLVEFKTAIPPYDKPFLPTPGSEITFYIELPSDARQATLAIMRVRDMINKNLIATKIAEHTVRFEDAPWEKTASLDVLLDEEDLIWNN